LQLFCVAIDESLETRSMTDALGIELPIIIRKITDLIALK
jgi:hypothetical protein